MGDHGERALVLHPRFKSPSARSKSNRDPEACLKEAVGLAEAIELDIVHREVVISRAVRPGYLLGKGVVDTFTDFIEAWEIGLVVVDAALTPVQQRNLERVWQVKVIDRTALILEIFGARARTHEGRLQVELASLEFQRSRLVRSWTHLERQRGGAGFLGGPGESQLEIDRRLIDDRIGRIKRDLEKVKRTRELHRSARKRVPFPVVALVGYTNAGKSTLFNHLTDSQVMAEDLLFATLDPTMRRVDMPSGRTIILSDTVGFVSDLPTHLVAAFRATLEEVTSADLVIHVRDVAHQDTDAQRGDVMKVLQSLEITEDGDQPMLEVLNKIDLLSEDDRAAVQSTSNAMAVSALTGLGCDALCQRIDAALSVKDRISSFELDPGQGAAIAWLYENGDVLEREDGESGVRLRVSLSSEDAGRFDRRFRD
jgi:GTP-binding protein HflX